MEMEGSVKSGVLKKRSSSGCLIIKKKFGDKNSGRGLGGLSDNYNEKYNARLLDYESSSTSSSSDEDEPLEFMRRKVTEKKLNKGSKSYKKNQLENRECARDNVRIGISGERKRSRLEFFDFDEYDEFDSKKMRNCFVEDMFKKVGGNGSAREDFVVDNKKQVSLFNGSSSGSRKGLSNKGLAFEDDQANMPISLPRSKFQKAAGEPIRVQGKNGVLKVMVNKKKKVDFPSQSRNEDFMDLKERKDSCSNDVVKKELFVDKDKSVEKEKIEGRIQVYSSKKGKKNKEERFPRPENLTPLKVEKVKEGKEGKAQHGGSTEKQKLREKIRGMLLDAGWTIDYRPRRNRDYLDSVYISPSGTAYWSITKAYDAFKKQLEEDDGETKAKIGSSSFAPLPEDLIHKLTRQTKNKIKEGMKRKKKEDKCADSSGSDQNDEKLWEGKLSKGNSDGDDYSSDESPKRKREKVRVGKPSTGFNSNVIQGRTNKVLGRCTLMVRGYDKRESSDSDGYIPYSGKRTILAWLIDSGKARLSEKVQYMNRKRTRAMLEGWVTRDGIHCGCCSKILTVSKFELHAGSKLRQPFQNIFLESGLSLLQCQIDAWDSQEESLLRDYYTVDVDGDDPDDDTCGVCGDGGDLICCDSCPSTFHQSCLEIQVLPSGDWYCPNCTCKFCGCGSGNVAEENNNSGNELNICSFCEKKYHESCGENVNALPTSSNGACFCGLKCKELSDHLQKILGIKHELEAGFSWSLIQRKDASDASHHGLPQRVECNSKLAVALSVMDECFLPIIDRKSGINLIHSVVYNCGSNFNRLNYRGFYTAILERGDELISAASIRLHEDRLAEMPFIATREIYRRQGMCRRLLSAIESELSSLKVRYLIIPTISEHMNTWTSVFGFHKLEDVHKKEIKSTNVLVFPGTNMLQKQLVKQEDSDVVKISHPTTNHLQLPVLFEKSDKPASSDSGTFVESKPSDKVDAVDSHSPPPTLPSKATRESDNAAPSISGAISGSDFLPHGPETTSIKPEMENEQKESSDNLKCPPNPSESNTWRAEAPSADSNSAVTLEGSKFANAEVNVSLQVKVTEDTGPKKTVDNSCVEYLSGSAFEKSTEIVTKDEVYGKPDEENINRE